jgi:hypothetical protein
MNCVDLSSSGDRDELLAEACSWHSIAAAIRQRAHALEADASDLREWADLLDGLAALDDRQV